MAEPVGPAIARQRIHTRLRELREERQLPAAEVATAMRWSLSKLNRIENGRVTIEPIAIKALLEFYGVRDRAEITHFMDLSETSRERAWWRDRDLAEDFKDFIAYENEASHLYAANVSFVPGLLQTHAYAVAITSLIRGTDPADPVVAEVVDVRTRRQESLLHRLDGDLPPSLTHVIDEAVLLRPVGGTEVMAGQLDHLLEMADRPTVRIAVLPLDRPGHPGLGGNFELLEFLGAEDDDVVFYESLTREVLSLEKKDRVRVRRTLRTLLDIGLTGHDAIKAVRAARKRLTR